MKKNLLFTVLLSIAFSAFGQELIKNGTFTDPDNGRDYKTIDSIAGWQTDDHRLDCNVRTYSNSDAVCNQWDGAGSFYQVVGVVPAEETTFKVTFKIACTYSYWAGWNVPVYVIFSSFTGDDPKTRVPFDTLGFEFWTGAAHYGIDSAIDMQLVLPAGSPLAGQKLAIEFKQIRSADYGYDESWTYLNYDDISVIASGGKVIVDTPETGTELLQNGDFSLPADSVEHKNINNIPAWKTDTQSEDYNGRSNVNSGPRTKEAVAWLWDETPGVYQIVGTVPAVATQYEVSFELSCFYTWWSDYKSDFFVIFSSFNGTDSTARVPLDTLKFNYDCVSSDWFNFHTLTGTYTLDAGNAHAGEKLVIEFKPYNSLDFGYGSSYTYFWLDNCSVKESTVAVADDNLVKNGDFSLPNDSVEHKNLNNIPNWKTDTQSEDYNGRSNVNTGPRTGEAVAWLWDETPGVYQVIDTVPSTATKYAVNFELSCFYSWWSDYKSDFFVIFSSFSGNDATTRVPIDTIKYVYDCKSSDWYHFSAMEGSITIAPGNPHAGEKLVVEFVPYNSTGFGYGSSYTYFWLDNVVVKSSPAIINGIERKPVSNIQIKAFNHTITIDGAHQIDNVSLYNLMGQKIFSTRSNSNQIKVPEISGLYIIVVDADHQQVSHKAIF